MPSAAVSRAERLGALAELLAEILTPKLSAALTLTTRKFLDFPAASTYSGLGQGSLRRLVAEGKLHVYRPVPGRCLLDREQLDEYIRSATAVPTVRRGRPRA